jgi:hypothetical protein
MTLNPITEHDALPAFKAGAPLQDSFLAQTLIALVAIAAVVAIMMVNGFLLGPAPRAQQAPSQLPSAAPRSAATLQTASPAALPTALPAPSRAPS